MSRVALVATDLDGTLLDGATYDFAPARPAVEALRRAGIPLVLCSSKTRAEMVPLAAAIGAPGPLVVENGGAVVHPGGSVLVLGADRARLLAELPGVAREAGVRVVPFAEMSADCTSSATISASRALAASSASARFA
jgi:mannosyl-3-phosphoglycerate phosphatase